MPYFFQELNNELQNIRKKLRDAEEEHSGCNEMLRCQANELKCSAEREKKLKKELEVRLFDYCYQSQQALTLSNFIFEGWSLLVGLEFHVLDEQNIEHLFCRKGECHFYCEPGLRVMFKQQVGKGLCKCENKANFTLGNLKS